MDDLGKAIKSFIQIREHATSDTFLEVYNEKNDKLYTVTDIEFITVLEAAKETRRRNLRREVERNLYG